jgi:hypothetical protein
MTAVNVQQVEQANKKAQFLNGERNKQIGQQEAARQSYERAIFAYKSKFGVQLDDTNLQQEFNDVSQKLTSDFDSLNAMILSIESGEYKAQQQTAVTIPSQQPQGIQIPQQAQAVQIASVTQEAQAVQIAPVIQEAQTIQQNTEIQHIQPQQAQAEGTQEPQRFSIDPSLITQTVQPQPTFAFGQPAQPQVQQQPENSQPAELQQNTAEKQDVSEQPFTPQGWGQPTKDINANFQNLMGGQKFGQQ